MMALFLVLWIISQDEQIKGNVQQYFRTRFASVTKQSVGIIPIENADLIRAKRAHFDKAAAIPLDQVRRLNDDLRKVFADNPEFIDMKYSMRMTDEGLLIEFFNDPNRRLRLHLSCLCQTMLLGLLIGYHLLTLGGSCPRIISCFDCRC